MDNIFENKLFEAFANAASNMYIYVTDIDNNLTRWSKSAVDFFGIEDEYQYNTGEKWLQTVHPEDRDRYYEDIMDVLSGKKAQHNCQYRAKSKYGEYVWVECKGSIILDSKGENSIFAGIMTRLDNQNKYDNLTHLPTGYELTNLSFSGKGTLMIIGIDNFRKINSRYGLVYGNEVLVYLANQLVECAGETACAYRFQGDEFALYSKVLNAAEMAEVFKRVYEKCASPAEGTDIIGFNVSAGIVGLEDNENGMRALSDAELSLSYAKNDGTNHYTIYSSDISSKQNRKDIVSEELLKAIEDDFKGFYLVYQPILSNEGDTVVACEALVRWKTDNEAIGACYPDEFISILERNGGINALGNFVMRQAIKQAGIWQKKYKKFNVSFNVSYMQLNNPGFIPSIIETIDEFGVDPSGIVVELTESVLDVDTVLVKQSFDILKNKGIKIALDDFGTGNSSFWMLHNIEVDIVKLDQSFIRGLDTSGKGIDFAIVESVGLMCNRIGCKTVAEGVETNDIWKLISGFGFTGLQGYLFSRPVETTDYELLLDKYNMNLV